MVPRAWEKEDRENSTTTPGALTELLYFELLLSNT